MSINETTNLIVYKPVRFAGWGPGGMGVECGSCGHSNGASAICTALVDATEVRDRCVNDVGGRLSVCNALSRHGSLVYLLFAGK